MKWLKGPLIIGTTELKQAVSTFDPVNIAKYSLLLMLMQHQSRQAGQ